MSDILFGFMLLALLAISGLCAGIISGMYSLNHYQLKRKAQLGDEDAKIVYPIHALHFQLLVTLMILNIIANASIAILLDTKMSGLFAVIFSSLFILIVGEILPMIFLRNHVITVTARLAPVLKKVIVFMTPVTKPVARMLDRLVGEDIQLFYTKEELLKIFDAHHLSKDSDIAKDEIRMLKTVLEFGDKKIRDCMTPMRMVTMVKADDTAGPLLASELHNSGHSRFPVASPEKQHEFVGTLYLRDLVGMKASKPVQEIMQPEVRYVHEEESLDHALRAFLRLRHHLFVVVNNFEEFVGVLSIEDVLEEVIGVEIVDEFDQHDDLRAVAASIAEKEAKARHKNTTTSEAKK